MSTTGPVGPNARYDQGAPLGGTGPPPASPEPPPSRGPIVLAAVLLVAAVLCGAASLLVWRDYGRTITAGAVTGWDSGGGAIGRGWIAITLGVVLAVAGVLVAADRERAGRILAVLGGVAAMGFAVAEWGLGAGSSRTGPGPGLWMLFGLGFLVVLAVGVIRPEQNPPAGSG